MNVRLYLSIASLVLLAFATSAALADSPAKPIFERVSANPKDPVLLGAGLVEIDAVIAASPKDPDAHYVRGWILARQDKGDEAIASYDRAFALDKKLSSALYNAGVVHAESGRNKPALAYFERTLAVEPKHIDAAYNAGQVSYNDKKFAQAAKFWKLAADLQPDDFDIIKKLLQAHVAIDKPKDIEKTRARLLALKKSSQDPRIAAMKTFVFDQLDVGKYHVYVHEAFDISGDLAYLYRFDVTLDDRSIGSVNLETSAIIRELGTEFILGIDKENKHTTLSQYSWKSRPAYKPIRALAIKIIKENF